MLLSHPQLVEEGEDADGGNWRRRLLGPRPDPVDKQRRKEEKRAREDEKRKIKEEERRQKEQQKSQRKLKKGKGPPGAQGTGGWTLEELAEKEECLRPLFVEKCVAFIEEEGLTTEGLYRVPGNRAHVELLMERFKEGGY